MRNNKLMALIYATGLLLAFACSENDDNANPKPLIKEDGIAFDITQNEAWNENYKVGFFCAETQPATENVSGTVTSSKTNTNQAIATSSLVWNSNAKCNFYAYYPFREHMGNNPKSVVFLVESEQSQKGQDSTSVAANTFMYAHSENATPSNSNISLIFTRVVPILKFSFKTTNSNMYGKTISALTLTSDDGNLSGYIEKNLTDNTAAEPKPVQTSKTIKLNIENLTIPTDGSTLNFYVAVLPNKIKTIKAALTIGQNVHATTFEINETLDASKNYNFALEEGKLEGVSLYEPTLDCHYDMREVKFESNATGKYSVDVVEGEWLKVSTKSNYTDAFNSDLGTNINDIDVELGVPSHFYIYADEYVDADENAAKIRTAKIKITMGDFYVEKEINQHNIELVGLYGEYDTTYGAYTKQLGVETIDEYLIKLFDDAPATLPTSKPWGYYQIATNQRNEDDGKEQTRRLAENLDENGVAFGASNRGNGMESYPQNSIANGIYKLDDGSEATIYNTIAARYCYNKNRDLNGNGRIDDDEMKWYLPATNQLLSVREAQSDGKLSETFQDYQYWSSHENSSGNTAVVNFGTYGNGKAQKPKFYPCHARCVRNIE